MQARGSEPLIARGRRTCPWTARPRRPPTPSGPYTICRANVVCARCRNCAASAAEHHAATQGSGGGLRLHTLASGGAWATWVRRLRPSGRSTRRYRRRSSRCIFSKYGLRLFHAQRAAVLGLLRSSSRTLNLVNIAHTVTGLNPRSPIPIAGPKIGKI